MDVVNGVFTTRLDFGRRYATTAEHHLEKVNSRAGGNISSPGGVSLGSGFTATRTATGGMKIDDSFDFIAIGPREDSDPATKAPGSHL